MSKRSATVELRPDLWLSFTDTVHHFDCNDQRITRHEIFDRMTATKYEIMMGGAIVSFVASGWVYGLAIFIILCLCECGVIFRSRVVKRTVETCCYFGGNVVKRYATVGKYGSIVQWACSPEYGSNFPYTQVANALNSYFDPFESELAAQDIYDCFTRH